jgi:hypothetical protein
MKWKSFYLILFFLASQLLVFAQVTKNNVRNTSLLPLKMGNYWVYSSSQADKKDTIKIIKTKIIGSDTAYYFKQSLMLVKNDTVFEFQLYGNGNPVPSVQYFPAEVDMNYTILVGGDAVAGRSVKKLKAPYKVNGKEYLDCYEFSDKLFNKTTIFARGVGIIEMRYPDQIISLIDYRIK